MNTTEFTAWLNAQLGKPYVWGANGPDKMDCSGLVYCAYNASGNARTDTTAQGLYNRTVPTDSPRLGDLAFLHSSGYISHVGVMLDSHTVIEARGRAWGVVKTPLATFKSRTGYTFKGIRRDPAFKLATPVTTGTSARAWVGFAAQQNVRFGGSFASNSVARAYSLRTLLNCSVFGITESDNVMESCILSQSDTLHSVALSTRTINIFFNSTKWAPKPSREVLHGDGYHGALCVPLVNIATGQGFDFIVNHTRPKSVASEKDKRGDIARTLSLVGTWPYVLAGDFAMNADPLIPASRISLLSDTYDPEGFQPMDAMYGKGVKRLDTKILDPGKLSDHKWIRTQIEIGASA